MTIRDLYEQARENGSEDKPIKICLYDGNYIIDEYDLEYYSDYADKIIIPVDIAEE